MGLEGAEWGSESEWLSSRCWITTLTVANVPMGGLKGSLPPEDSLIASSLQAFEASN
jgi:hypothetical protein